MDVSDASLLPPLISRSLLFGNPERVAPRLSPDGSRIAYLAPRDGVMNVWVRTLDQEESQPVTQEKIRPIRQFDWAENGRQILYMQDAGGDENFHVFLADVTNGETRDLTPFPGVRAYIACKSHRHEDTVLLTYNQRDRRYMDTFRCDLRTAERVLVAENPGNVVTWLADFDLCVRAAVASTGDGGFEIWGRDNEESAWRTLLTVPFGEDVSLIAFSVEGDILFFISNYGVDTRCLYQMDMATGQTTLLHSREGVDLFSTIFHPTQKTLQAVGYNRARLEWAALDPAVGEDLEALRQVEPGADFNLVSRDRADENWCIAFHRDSAAPRFYHYRRANRQATFLFSNRPALEGATLANVTPIDIPARDGRILPSYLTLPPGLCSEKLPLVLHVHGGPWARDLWAFHPDIQWLANRGYAVLQVNYRGSAGFGKAHLNAGNREWAGKMHDDLIDAVNWAIAQGVVDPARVAIMGGSYGGYATLVGLTFTPELFACGVAVVGPSSLITLLNSIPPYWAPMKKEFTMRVGDPETEEAFLLSRSPLTYADRIVRPLLVAQGANDPRVTRAESDQIVEAARRSGKEVTYLLFEDEGHGFARPENRLKFYAVAEAFLARHLGGRFEPAHLGEEPPLVE